MQCIERAEGNPLFLEQLLRNARRDEAGLAPTVPPTIQSLVLARMDRLAAATIVALQAAAVIGKRFSLSAARCRRPAARRLRCPGCRRPGSSRLRRLSVRARADPGGRVRLDVEQPEARVARAAARWYGDAEPVLHAEHLDRAEDAAAAAAYLRAAGDEAARLRFETALRLAQRGGVLAQMTRSSGHRLAMLRGDLLRELGRRRSRSPRTRRHWPGRRRSAALPRVAGRRRGPRVTGEFAAAMQALDMPSRSRSASSCGANARASTAPAATCSSRRQHRRVRAEHVTALRRAANAMSNARRSR